MSDKKAIIFELLDRACILAADLDHESYECVATARALFRAYSQCGPMANLAVKIHEAVANELSKED